jgi:alpha-1,3-glucan synthase
MTFRNQANEIFAMYTNRAIQSTDHLIFRIGQQDNPVIFPRNASHTTGLLNKNSDGSLAISHKAAGAEQFRYSLNWGSSYSAWQPYKGGSTTLAAQPWSGTKRQEWKGQHVIVQYHSRIAGSSDSIQHGDLDPKQPIRRFPHLFLEGMFNMFGLDGGVGNTFSLKDKGEWIFDLMTEWPTRVQINVWGINPDGQPDQTGMLGDLDGDKVLDRLPPNALSPAFINVTDVPPSPYLGWKLSLDDGTYRYDVLPVGNRLYQIIIFFIMWVVPLVTGVAAVWLYMTSFYKVKFNAIGANAGKGLIPLALRKKFRKGKDYESIYSVEDSPRRGRSRERASSHTGTIPVVTGGRRSVLIATMEYDIEDWAIKIKIGGLGVMAQVRHLNSTSPPSHLNFSRLEILGWY